MRRVRESEIETEFERQYAWGDDERHYYHPNRRKASVMGFFLRLETVLELVARYNRPAARVADFASAQGTFAVLLAERGFDVTAVDLNPDFLRYAQKKHERGKLVTVQSNIIEYRSPLPFDCVIMGEVIEHVAFPGQLLAAARENLRPGGVLVLTTPNGEEAGQGLPTFKQVENLEALIPRQFHWGDHLFLYTEAELRELFDQAGFEVLEVRKQNSSYVSQIKGLRYCLPLAALRWLERRTRTWRRGNGDSTNSIVIVGRRRQPA